MRFLNICLFINFFVCLSATAQQYPSSSALKKAIDSGKVFFTMAKYETSFSPTAFTTNNTVKTIPASYYTNSLSFFCKKELQLEKAVKIPVKMRLGNVTYTDQLEGKITSRRTE